MKRKKDPNVDKEAKKPKLFSANKRERDEKRKKKALEKRENRRTNKSTVKKLIDTGRIKELDEE